MVENNDIVEITEIITFNQIQYDIKTKISYLSSSLNYDYNYKIKYLLANFLKPDFINWITTYKSLEYINLSNEDIQGKDFRSIKSKKREELIFIVMKYDMIKYFYPEIINNHTDY